LTGAYHTDSFAPDEAVAALLAFGRATERTGPSAFDRIAAYRNGSLQGLSACM
jgi:hypothetical protein